MTSHPGAARDQEGAASDSASPPLQTTPSTGFLDLYAELRNSIYFAVLVNEDPLWVTATCRSRLMDGTPAPLAAIPALTQVCRSVRAEALPIFYGSNTFSVTLMREGNVARAKRWVEAIGDSAVAQIKELRLHGYVGTGVLVQEPPFCRVRIRKLQDGNVEVRNDTDPVWHLLLPPRSLQGRIEAFINEASNMHAALSKAADLEALIERFASDLYFREYEHDLESSDNESALERADSQGASEASQD